MHYVNDGCDPPHRPADLLNGLMTQQLERAKRDPDSPLYEPTRKNAHPERDLQNAILQWLTLKKICHVRLNVATSTIWKKGQTIRLPSAMKGWPDILVIFKGRAIGLEVKWQTKQSDEQKEIERYITEVGGGVYRVVRSLEDVEKLINEVK